MSNIQSGIQHGKLVLPEESLDKIKSLSENWVDKTQMLAILLRGENEGIEISVHIDQILTFGENEEDSSDIEEIFLNHILSDYGGVIVKGRTFDLEGVEWSIEILYLFSGGFGVYRFHLDPVHPTIDPSMN